MTSGLILDPWLCSAALSELQFRDSCFQSHLLHICIMKHCFIEADKLNTQHLHSSPESLALLQPLPWVRPPRKRQSTKFSWASRANLMRLPPPPQPAASTSWISFFSTHSLLHQCRWANYKLSVQFHQNNEIIQTNTGNLGIPNWGLWFHDRAEIYWEDQRKRWAEETKYWRQLYCDQIMWFNIEDNKFAWSPYLCTVSTTLCPHDIPEWCFSRRKFCLPSQKHSTYCASLHQKHSGKFWKYVILFSI